MGGMKDGGWSTTEKGWQLDPSQRERVTTVHLDAMARIDRTHVGYPECWLCGQRAIKLDKHGLCSKVSVLHKEARAAAAAESKAGVR
ncbi:hypothetical protein [Microbacterium rhizomatis]|uniref:Uncharacterized protein n=1 Tax=Microbacterium rhizomatis TaxID=1631477 RepID=A0A5J5J5U4_9MICO|nr:hypothetical protein [Microbacterium rhizomatis]KAA9110163.1 hypothetical protein F6B43_00170 [Microbacterium rhizomatis]